MKFKQGDKVVWRPKPGSDWDYPSKRWSNVPPVGTVGTAMSDCPREHRSLIGVLWEHNDCVCDNFPPESLEPYVEEPQAGINWLYPENDHEWKEGDEIIAKYTIPAIRAESTACMQYKIIQCCEWSYYAWEFADGNNLPASNVRIKAYVPCAEPKPPERPQDCPFCGAKMKVYENAYRDWIAICSRNDCMFRIPSCKTEAEAIKALNRVRLVAYTACQRCGDDESAIDQEKGLCHDCYYYLEKLCIGGCGQHSCGEGRAICSESCECPKRKGEEEREE